MAGNLISPRVRVTWADVNLSAYNGKGQFPQGNPLVYDVEVDLQSQSSAPTGSMKWDPTGPGFAEYEKFISDSKYMESRIFIDFFYAGGKRIRFAFVWAGQSISYGNDMTVTVSLKSELDGLINADIRNVTQAYDEKKGGTGVDSVNRLIQQYRVPKNIVRYNETSERDLTKMKILTNYAQDQTFGAAVANTVQQNGNVAFANNIEEPNVAIYPPFSWNKDTEVLNGFSDIPVDTSPLPQKRYGYVLGPSNINTIQRQSQWNPPQQTTQNTPSTQVRARDYKTGQFTSQKPATAAQKQAASTGKASSSPLGTANARPNPGIQNKDNPDGPTKQNLLNEEGTSTLSFQTLLTPLLVGIKPFDIVYIPSLKGEFIEDWIVDTVSYDQNDGNVSVSVQAKRKLGLGVPMNEKSAQKFKDFAKAQGLIGPNATLENWDKYTWTLKGTPTAAETEEEYYNRVYGEA